MDNIAIIPARSGSKGLKDKNIKLLNGKPMLAYSIEAASQSGIFSCVHVSTDSEEYAKIARDYGADVPFLRSEAMSSDTASSWDVVKEVLRKYQEMGRDFSMFTLLQPTSPCRKAEDIINCYGIFQKKGTRAVVSICETEHSPLWSNVLPENGSMEGFVQKYEPRQLLDAYYRINGAVYMLDCKFLFEDIHIYRQGCFAYIMSRENSIDIDTQFDFDVAEFLLQKEQGREKNVI